MATLTRRQRQILDLLSRGYSYGEIGQRLGIKQQTVANQIQRSHDPCMTGLLQRLDARNSAHAVRRGFESGILASE